MNAGDKIAAVCVGVACGSIDIADALAKADAILHTLTLGAGFLSAVAACIYYWTNRKVSRGNRGPKGDTGDTGPRGDRG